MPVTHLDPTQRQVDGLWRVGRALAWLDDGDVILHLALGHLHEIAGEHSVACYLSARPGGDLAVPASQPVARLRKVLSDLGCLSDLDSVQELSVGTDVAPIPEWVLVVPLRAGNVFWGTLAVAGPESLRSLGELLGEFGRFMAAGLKWAAFVDEERR